jgi:glucan phosphoethanolaminetransferase (alkaline phosphatase superfamily)
MIDAASGLLTAFGLSASAGLNAYLPLMVVALLARFTTLVTLNPPYDHLTDGWVMLVIGVLLAIELFADRVPVLDTANDIVQTFIRPAAGAILFAASSSVISDVHPVLALICGLIVAGGVHATKATVRPVVTGTSGGLLNPVVSTAEDVTSLTLTLLSILVPLLAGLLLGVLLVMLVWWFVARRRRKQVAS